MIKILAVVGALTVAVVVYGLVKLQLDPKKERDPNALGKAFLDLLG